MGPIAELKQEERECDSRIGATAGVAGIGAAPTKLRKREIIWQPQPGPQTHLIKCPLPEIFFGGARGGGKTSGVIGKWVQHASLYGQKARGIFFRRSFPELEEVQRQMMELLPRLGAVYKSQPRLWLMSNGATLKLRYLERDADAARYQGHSYTIALFDESGNWATPEPIDKIRATLRSPEGVPTQMILTGNPGGPGHQWLKERYIDPAPPLTPFTDPVTEALRVFIPSNLKDNRKLLENDPTYIARLRASGPLWLVKAWLEGDWNSVPEGGMFKLEWFGRYRVPPAYFDQIVMSWDTASKAAELNCPWCCTVWGVKGGNYYLLYCFTKRMEFPEGKRTAGNLMLQWQPNVVLIEDKSTGQTLIQELRQGVRDASDFIHYFNLIPINPCQDKVTRASVESPAIESGRVWLPESAPWLPEYELVMTTFPKSTINDPVDSTSQFLAYMRERQTMDWDGAVVTGDRRIASDLEW